MRLAAIDVGTNTTRLLVAEEFEGSYRDLDRRVLFTRLGQGVDADRTIAPAAMKRTLAAIAEFCSVCGEFGVHRITIAGTSAVRDAANGCELLRAARKLSGGPAVVLTGEQEARLSFWGSTAELDPTAQLDMAKALVFDIGGGSTEFVLGVPGREIEGRISLDIGSVRLTERFLASDPPATEEILLMEGAIDQALEAVDVVMPRSGQAVLVGLGGTVTTLAAIHLGLSEYAWDKVHHVALPREGLDKIYRSLAEMRLDMRASMPMLPVGRADVIVAGASILSRVLTKLALDPVIVSEKDILDGLLLQMMGSIDLLGSTEQP